MHEEYEIIFITEEGRAIKNNKTGKIYHSEFEIIEEKNKEIERLNNIINELEDWLGKQRIRNSEWDNFVIKDTRLGIPITYLLDKLKELKENNKNV